MPFCAARALEGAEERARRDEEATVAEHLLDEVAVGSEAREVVGLAAHDVARLGGPRTLCAVARLHAKQRRHKVLEILLVLALAACRCGGGRPSCRRWDP